MAKKLTDTQRVVLSLAAMQPDGALFPIPKSLRLNAGALTTVLRSLLKQELVLERAAKRDDVAWRQEETGERFMLVIADEGYAAIGVDPIRGTSSGARSKSAYRSRPSKAPKLTKPAPAKADTSQPREGTKLASLITALEASDGATIDDLMTATGWQAHSVRGAISGALQKTFKLAVASTKIEGRGRVYSIASDGRSK